MAESKTLKIGFELQDQQFQKVKTALQQLTAEAERFQKALQGAPGGGQYSGAFNLLSGGRVNTGSPQTPKSTPASPTAGISQNILASVDAFKKYAKEGSQALKQVTDAMKAAYREQSSELNKLQDEYAKLTVEREYALGGDAVKEVEALDKKMASLTAQIAKASNASKDMSKAIGDISGGGVFKGKGLFDSIGPGGATPGSMIQSLFGNGVGPVLMRGAGMIAGGTYNAVKMGQAWNNTGLDLAAQRGEMINPMLQRAQKGDITDAMLMQELKSLSGMDKQDVLRRFQGVDIETLNAIQGGIGAVKDFATGGAAGSGLTSAALDNKKMAQMKQAMEALKNTTQYQEGAGRGFRYLNETEGSRMMTSGLIGAGFYERKNAAGQTVLNDTYTDFATRAMKSGFMPEEIAAGVAHGRALGGSRFGGQFGGRIASANIGGYAGVGDILAAGAKRGNVGSTLAAFGMGADKTAGIHLAQAVMGTGFDATGTTNRQGVMAAIQGGFGQGGLMGGFTNTAQDFNTVQRIAGGLATGNAISQGFDPYQQGRNTLAAIQAMPGATTYGQDALAGMKYEELLDVARGGTSLTSRAYGIDKAQARAQLGALGSSVLDRYVDQGGNDPLSMAMKEFRGAQAQGMDLPEYLKTLKGTKGGKSKAEALGVFIGQQTGMGAEAGVGYVGIESGIEDLAKQVKTGTTPGGKRDDLIVKKLSLEADAMAKSADLLKGSFDTLKKAFESAPEIEKALSSFGRFAVAFDAMSDKIFAGLGIDTKTQSKMMESAKAVSKMGAYSLISPAAAVGNMFDAIGVTLKP